MAQPAAVLSQIPWSALGVIVIAGVAGGIVNCILSHDGFCLPYLSKNKEGRTVCYLGSLSNIALGIAGSFLVWAFGADEITNLVKQVGVCFVAGVSGGNIVLTFVQKQKLALDESKQDAYDSVVKEALGIQEAGTGDDQNEKG